VIIGIRHKKKDLTLQELISHIIIEEANHIKARFLSLNSSKATIVEFGVPIHKDRFKGRKE